MDLSARLGDRFQDARPCDERELWAKQPAALPRECGLPFLFRNDSSLLVKLGPDRDVCRVGFQRESQTRLPLFSVLAINAGKEEFSAAR